MKTHLKIAQLMLLVVVSITSFTSHSFVRQKVALITDEWPPYINKKGATTGSAAKLVEVLFKHHNVNTQWIYLPYEYSWDQIKNQKTLISFPYFKTEKRSEHALFSKPVFSVTSKVYYNRQYLNAEQAERAFSSKTSIGKVAGYSYGESIDKELTNAKEFASEDQALTALLNNDISLLPMTSGVMNYQLTENFPQRKQLIVAINNITDTSSLHVIAAKNSQGARIIKKIDKALEHIQKQGMTSLLSTNTEVAAPVDVAKLISSEGYPLIIGQSAAKGENIQYYTLPQGCKVLVTSWSPKILQASHNDSIYKNMMDLSKVVLLNGPHVGKELFVRNMHIELQ